ncbi:MAG TPA: superoxide dismutase, Ni [Candidatus Saccharimonadia bacterium]|nr:superoxide dismutase, Ni [Candidatus Saccharimonadia bacterium]
MKVGGINMYKAISRMIKPVYAHCDLPCGVYDPMQAMIEAKSIEGILKKYPELGDTDKQRAIFIKEQRAELVKHHLWVLWTDYFKPKHLEKYPELHTLTWETTKQAGKTKKTVDVVEAQKLIAGIEKISKIFWETKKPV